MLKRTAVIKKTHQRHQQGIRLALIEIALDIRGRFVSLLRKAASFIILVNFNFKQWIKLVKVSDRVQRKHN